MAKREYTIDRIEEGIAICEGNNTENIKINLSQIPNDAKEGDILIYEDDKYYIDENKTKQRLDEMRSLLNNLYSKK